MAPQTPAEVLQPTGSVLSVSVFLSDVPESDLPDNDYRAQQSGSVDTVESTTAKVGRFLFNPVDTGGAFFSSEQVFSGNSDYWQQQDDQALREQVFENMVVGSTAMVSTSVSVGYVVWLLRGGSLLTTFLSSLPAWQAFDPLYVLNSFEENGDENQDSESLESLVS